MAKKDVEVAASEYSKRRACCLLLCVNSVIALYRPTYTEMLLLCVAHPKHQTPQLLHNVTLHAIGHTAQYKLLAGNRECCLVCLI